MAYAGYCGTCGEPFTGRVPHQSFCSKICQRRSQYARHRIYLKRYRRQKRARRILEQQAIGQPPGSVRYMGWCKRCGAPFVDGRSKVTFCSSACANRHHASQSAGRRRRGRAVHLKGDRQVVYLADLFVRDGGKCQICGEHVRREISHPHPRSPSIDHIVPVSAGGSDGFANLQLAHLRCNMLKSDRATAGSQLRLM